jgi:hypothetical protein
LFRARSVHGVEALRGFPLPVAATAFTARCPPSSSCRLKRTMPVRRSEERRLDTARISAPGAPQEHRGPSTLRNVTELEDYCTWEVRSRWSGVTRHPPAVPLSAFQGPPSRSLPLSLGRA